MALQLSLDVERLPLWLGGDITFQSVSSAFVFSCKVDFFSMSVGTEWKPTDRTISTVEIL